jgi:hypothetical protein
VNLSVKIIRSALETARKRGFITHNPAAGVSEELRRKVTLHSDSEIHARYTHHEAGPLRAALGTLPDVSGK